MTNFDNLSSQKDQKFLNILTEIEMETIKGGTQPDANGRSDSDPLFLSDDKDADTAVNRRYKGRYKNINFVFHTAFPF